MGASSKGQGLALLKRRSQFESARARPSEVELHRQLHDTMALLVGRVAEQRSVHRARGRIETDLQVLPVIEGPQRMVQEVVTVDTELQLLRLTELEVFEKPQIGVEEPRSVDGRQDGRPVLPDLRWESETA